MKPLNELEKEFEARLNELMLSLNWYVDQVDNKEDREQIARACAALCQEKIDQAKLK